MELRLQARGNRLQKKLNIWLIILCLFFLATRLFAITQVPPALYWDEASIGYNAYSILHTGHDEWGKSFPIHFRAFGEFKLPVYIYTTVLTEAIFGLSPLGIRLPAVLYSLGSLLLIYFLTKKIAKNELAGLMAAFSFTITPWFFIISRVGYEATAGLFFFLLATYLFLLSTEKKNRFLLLATVSLIASIYSYNSFRLISGLTILVAVTYTFWTNHSRKAIIICALSLLLFAISVIPILRLLIYDAGFGRVQAFSLFPIVRQVSDQSGKSQLQIIYNQMQPTDWTANLKMVVGNYLSHFSPQFLFFQGDPNPRNQQPGFGQLYYLDFPFLFLGLWALFKTKKLYIGLILFLLIISPIPASLFKEVPHALRATLTAPVLAIITGLGISWLGNKYRRLLLAILILYIVFFGFYFFNFLTTYPIKASADWQYGYKQIYTLYSSRFSNYDKIIISDHDAQPYIFPLTYLKIVPADFQKNAQRNPVDQWGFSTVESFDKFQFGKAHKIIATQKGRLLIFASEEDKLNISPTDEIKLLNGKTAYYVYSLTQ